MQENNRNYAIFVDGDNISPKFLESILMEVATDGNILIKRIYGDWTQNSMNGWKEVLQNNPVRAFQQFRNGHNATDNAIIMDAIEITHSNSKVDSVCIVSSDSDFYSLATRLREKGLYVLGIGEKKSNELWVKSCNQFLYLENLNKATPKIKSGNEKNKETDELLDRLKYGVDNSKVAIIEGTVPLARVGKTIRDQYPDFDLRTYGAKSLLSAFKKYQQTFTLYKDDNNPPSYSVAYESDIFNIFN